MDCEHECLLVVRVCDNGLQCGPHGDPIAGEDIVLLCEGVVPPRLASDDLPVDDVGRCFRPPVAGRYHEDVERGEILGDLLVECVQVQLRHVGGREVDGVRGGVHEPGGPEADHFEVVVSEHPSLKVSVAVRSRCRDLQAFGRRFQ